MKVFITGATGFVGSAVVRELLANGHKVLGLARSDESAAALAATGADVLRGDLDDLDSLRSGAADADGVIHTAFIHDFTNYARSADVDQRAIETIGDVLAGSERPFVVTAGLAGWPAGKTVTEEDAAPADSPRFSERAALALVERGVRASVVRLPPSVHGEGDHGFVPQLIHIARERGVSAYPGDGMNRWPAVHRFDAARLFRLALETAPTGTRLHAIGDQGVPTHEIAEAIGRSLSLPVVARPIEEAGEHFGWLGRFFATNILVSGELTQQRFDWRPVELSLLEDLDHEYYFRT